MIAQRFLCIVFALSFIYGVSNAQELSTASSCAPNCAITDRGDTLYYYIHTDFSVDFTCGHDPSMPPPYRACQYKGEDNYTALLRKRIFRRDVASSILCRHAEADS
ncbi:hypothetical protein C8R45DRAFT_1099596 [Mycena sanguinolenta]|nr:hypothetical protein C8R45DRAFT_1099596 [Mycena sanguinolenta]